MREYILIDPDASYAERYMLKDRRCGTPDIFGPKESFVLEGIFHEQTYCDLEKTVNTALP